METFAYRQRFITLHPPLKKLTTRRCDAPIKGFQVLGSSGKGIRDDRNNQIFCFKVRRRCAFLLAILVWSGCGGSMNVGGSSSTSNGVVITPAGMTLRAGDSTQFSAKVTGNANQSVSWSVNGVPTGNATVGTIDATGKYKAPAKSAHAEHGEDRGRQRR